MKIPTKQWSDGLFPGLLDKPLCPVYGQGSALEILRYEIASLPRGSYVSSQVMAQWAAKHGKRTGKVQADMRNKIQRMAGYAKDRKTSPRTPVDERVVPCEVRSRHIPQAIWAALGGVGKAYPTGYLIADIDDQETHRRWWTLNVRP
jgi:hypothetical protein